MSNIYTGAIPGPGQKESHTRNGRKGGQHTQHIVTIPGPGEEESYTGDGMTCEYRIQHTVALSGPR